MSQPRELLRVAPNIAAGPGIAGLAAGPCVATMSNGSRAIASAGTSTSVIWWTKDELAPFSSSRRTR